MSDLKCTIATGGPDSRASYPSVLYVEGEFYQRYASLKQAQEMMAVLRRVDDAS